MGSGPGITGTISSASSNSVRLAPQCLGKGQPPGNVRPHWVSLGGLMCEENRVPASLWTSICAGLQETRLLDWWHVTETPEDKASCGRTAGLNPPSP